MVGLGFQFSCGIQVSWPGSTNGLILGEDLRQHGRSELMAPSLLEYIGGCIQDCSSTSLVGCMSGCSIVDRVGSSLPSFLCSSMRLGLVVVLFTRDLKDASAMSKLVAKGCSVLLVQSFSLDGLTIHVSALSHLPCLPSFSQISCTVHISASFVFGPSCLEAIALTLGCRCNWPLGVGWLLQSEVRLRHLGPEMMHYCC